MSGIEGKVVAITGASSGIGEATARLLAEGGAKVVLGARRTERLDDITRQLRDGERTWSGWSAMVDVNLRGVLHGLAAALPVFRRQGSGHFVTTVSTAGLKIVPTMAVYAATKNAVRTLMEGLRQECTDGVVRTTSISPGFVDTELDSSINDVAMREQIRCTMNDFGLPPEAVARAIAFAIGQPHDVEISDITIRPTVQG